MNKDIVALEGMEFYAFHGFYEEEREAPGTPKSTFFISESPFSFGWANRKE